MNIFVLNCGSSSLKYQLINMSDESVPAKGLVERIGLSDSKLKHQPDGKAAYEFTGDIKDHAEAIKLVIAALTDTVHGVIASVGEISAVGHRVVHGGEHFTASVLIDDKVINAIEECCALAPLHNPPNLIGIRAMQSIAPDLKQVAVFDTAFHQTMPRKAYLYAIPYELYETHRIRRYGFHGTSHKFVAAKAAKMLNKPFNEANIITCHLGNGASIAAIQKGSVIDTSMGFTPLEGLVMGTRSGDIDPAVLSFLCDKEGMSVKEVDNLLNKQSGVFGVSGVSSDFRDIEAAAAQGNERAKAALEIFYYKVAKYIGSYAAALNGVDAIVFTAGLGENSADCRRIVCSYLAFMGVEIDPEKNVRKSDAIEITSCCSKVKVFAIPTNEELVIARDTKVCVE